MPKIFLCIPYFGKFPNYFPLYLDSLAVNKDILRVLFFTDIDLAGYVVPENARFVKMTKAELQTKIAHMIHELFNKEVEPEKLITTAYKLVDFKVSYPYLFRDILIKEGADEHDFVGWGDCDLIYGKLSNFLDFSQEYDIVGGLWGHFTAVKNTPPFQLFFTTVPSLLNLMLDNSRTFITDEIACREPLITFLNSNNYKMFPMHKHCCDIVPPLFYHMFRNDHTRRLKNFFDNAHSEKNIHHLFRSPSGILTVVYDDGFSREVAYVHMQKRAMTLPFSSYPLGYFLFEHGFHEAS